MYVSIPSFDMLSVGAKCYNALYILPKMSLVVVRYTYGHPLEGINISIFQNVNDRRPSFLFILFWTSYLPVHRSVVTPVSVEKGHNIWIQENRSYNDSGVVMHTFEWRWGNCVDAWSLTRPRSLPIFFLNTVDPIRRKSHMMVN